MSNTKIINLSHIKADKEISQENGNEILDEKPNKMINLSHVKSNIEIKVMESSTTLHQEQEIVAAIAEEEVEGQEIENGVSRIRPNSTFLRRYVGGMERLNEKLPIVAPSIEFNSSNCVENKAVIIQELKDAALEKLKNQPRTIEELRLFQMEGEAKIQQLAQYYCLSVQVTYLPHIPQPELCQEPIVIHTTSENEKKKVSKVITKKKRKIKLNEVTFRSQNQFLGTLISAPAAPAVSPPPPPVPLPVPLPQPPSSSLTSEPTLSSAAPPQRKKTLNFLSSQSSLLFRAIGQKKSLISSKAAERPTPSAVTVTSSSSHDPSITITTSATDSDHASKRQKISKESSIQPSQSKNDTPADTRARPSPNHQTEIEIKPVPPPPPHPESANECSQQTQQQPPPSQPKPTKKLFESAFKSLTKERIQK